MVYWQDVTAVDPRAYQTMPDTGHLTRARDHVSMGECISDQCRLGLGDDQLGLRWSKKVNGERP